MFGLCKGKQHISSRCCCMQAVDVQVDKKGTLNMSRRELEDMIVWETNNLYDYLKGLYEEQGTVAGAGFDRCARHDIFKTSAVLPVHQ